MKIAPAIFALTLSANAAPPAVPGKNHHALVEIAAGVYEVGHRDAATNPVRKATLKRFFIATTETTNAQFSAFIKATGYQTTAEKLGSGKVFTEGMSDWLWHDVKGATWRHPFGPDHPNPKDFEQHPVTQISGADARAYCQWLGARLPTIEEWEITARAGTSTTYPWGQKFDPKLANIWNGKSHRKDLKLDGFLYTSPVASFPPNAWGLYDVIGNVFEYCEGFPPNISFPKGAQKNSIAGRGGSWWCSAETCHFYNLNDIGTMTAHGPLANQGFRVVFDQVIP